MIGNFRLPISSNSGNSPLEWSQQYYDDIYANTMGVYVRPVDWLDIITAYSLFEGSQKFVGLYAVYPESNFCTITCTTSTGQYQVDWGDGNVTLHNSDTTAEYNFNYSSFIGTDSTRGYRQAIVVVTPVIGNLLSLNLRTKHTQPGLINGYTSSWLDIRMAGNSFTTFNLSGSPAATISSMLESFEFIGTNGLTTCENMFQNCYELVKINAFYIPSAGSISMLTMFTSCYSLQTIPLLNTLAVTNMSNMFSSCSSLQTIPLLNTLAVTTMSNMFSSCSSLQTIPLLNTLAVTAMQSMFGSCYSLQTIPLLNTLAVTTMSNMFSNCSSLQTIPLLNTLAVTNMSSMFTSCYSLQTIPLLNTLAVTTMSNMFSSCISLKTIPLLNTLAVTNMSNMFSSCYSLQTIPLLNTLAVTAMQSMFGSCISLKTIPLLNTLAVTNMSNMFSSCSSLQTIPLLNTLAVTTMSNMFSSCISLKTIPLLNTLAVTNMSSMFTSCRSLSSIKIDGWKNTFSVASCELGKEALVDIFNRLTVQVGKTITITGNWGAALLTPADRLIATNKGWAIVS